jgi:hypothetical protein
VNGGGGGLGTLELRYSNARAGAQTQSLTVRVNGQALPLVLLPATDNQPNWRTTNWQTARIENVPLNAGASNVIELATDTWYVAIDEILVANADRLTQAQPHRRVMALPTPERDALLAFLRELDGSETPLSQVGVFGDGFE